MKILVLLSLIGLHLTVVAQGAGGSAVVVKPDPAAAGASAAPVAPKTRQMTPQQRLQLREQIRSMRPTYQQKIAPKPR